MTNSIKINQHMNIDGTIMIPSCKLKENPRISFAYFSKVHKMKFVSAKVAYETIVKCSQILKLWVTIVENECGSLPLSAG